MGRFPWCTRWAASETPFSRTTLTRTQVCDAWGWPPVDSARLQCTLQGVAAVCVEAPCTIWTGTRTEERHPGIHQPSLLICHGARLSSLTPSSTLWGPVRGACAHVYTCITTTCAHACPHKHAPTHAGTGWTFDSAEAHKLREATAAAMHTFRQFQPSFLALARRGMAQDLSWDNAAEAYEQVGGQGGGGRKALSA